MYLKIWKAVDFLNSPEGIRIVISTSFLVNISLE